MQRLLREKVKQGLLTERSLARATETSQSHLHNVLKGVRALPPDLADRLMVAASLTMDDLMNPGPLREERDAARHPTFFGVGDGERRSCYLKKDEAMEPRFMAGDLVFFDPEENSRKEIESRSVYLVEFEGRELARYIRRGANLLYLVSEASLDLPAQWDEVSLAENALLGIVKGRILWICRAV